MTTSQSPLKHWAVILLFVCLLAPWHLFAEEENTPVPSSGDTIGDVDTQPQKAYPARHNRYHVPDVDRVDAGVFHVGFAGGGNFYIEPQVNVTTKAPLGTYYNDFGGQGGVYFDYDYSELTENVPLMLRGFVGYKYVLNSTHVFAFEGVARRMFRMSDNASFGIGMGGSAAVWYRTASSTSEEETIFLPSFLLEAGFEFPPFMTDVKWLVNRIGDSTSLMGFEMYFGFRL